MKLDFIKPGMILAAALALCAFPFRVQADQWDKKTIVTVDQPIQVTNTYLEPGTYVFKLANSSSNRNIVQIFNRDQNHLIDTIMAIPNYRLERPDRTQFSFWETPPGTARAVRAWFYPGDNFGQEFRYPTELRQIASAAAPPVPTFAPQPPVQPLVEPTPAPQSAPEQPLAQAVEPQQQEPVQIAQNSPPPTPEPAPAVQAPPPPAPDTSSSQELPKTASLYPLIGLGGLLSGGLFAFLRLRRLS